MQKTIKFLTPPIVFTFLALFFIFMIDARPLSAPDEGRYSEIPREMIETGDFVTPRLNGVKYFEKPPLMYWLTASAIKPLGLNEFAIRLWPMLLGLLTCLATFLFGRRFFGEKAALISTLYLGTNLFFYAHTRVLILDMAITAFMTITLLSFYWAFVDRNDIKKRRILTAIFFTSCAFSVLSKGLIGIAIPGAVIFLWIFITRNWQAFKIAFSPWGIALFLIIAAPWHILASIRNPEFAYFYFVHEHFLRYLTPVHNRVEPAWFFLGVILVGFFPWTSYLLHSLKLTLKEISTNPTIQFLGTGIIFIIIFFSLSKSKLIPYVLPCIPLLCLLMGWAFERINLDDRSTRIHRIFFQVLCIILAIATPILVYIHELWGRETIKPYILILSFTFLTSAIFMQKHYSRRIQGAIGVLILIIFNSAWWQADERSIKPLAMEFLNRYKPGDEFLCFKFYFQDLPPLINSKITVVDWNGELAFGMKQEDTTDWMISADKFYATYKPEKRYYIFTRTETLDGLKERGVKDLTIIAQRGKDILVTNSPTRTKEIG